MFRPLVEKLSGIEIIAVKLPGREHRFSEPAVSSLTTLIEQLLPATLKLFDKPCVFLGHSMGSLIAFELARALHFNHNICPEKLIVSAFRSPERKNVNKELHTLPDHEFVHELKKYGGTPDALFQDKSLIELLLPMMRADFTLHETYQHQTLPPLPCPIHACYGVTDHLTPFEHMEGWRKHTREQFSHQGFDGGHFYIHDKADHFCAALSNEAQKILETKVV